MSRHNILSVLDDIITPPSLQPLNHPVVRRNSIKDSHTKENLLLEAVERDIDNEDFSLLLYFLETAEEQQILENEKVAMDIASSVMQLIFHSQKEDKMLRKIFLIDIDQCMDVNIAFRETNLSILSLKTLFKLYKGEKCFINLLRPALAPLLMLDDHSDADQVGNCLLSTCNEVLDSIMTKLERISTRPKNNAFSYFIKGFGSIFALFSQLLNDLKISRDHIIQLLTSIFFLRFISPMICLPKEHGLLKQSLELAQQVRFVYLTKLIQAIANNQKDQRIITSLPKRFFRSYIKKSHSKVQSIVEIIINESTKLSGNERVELPRRYREEKCFSILQSFFNEHNQKVPENIWYPKTYSPFIHPPISTSPNNRTSISDGNLLKNNSNSVLNYTEYEELFKKEIRDHQIRIYGFALAPLEPHSIIPPLYGTLWSLQYEIAAVNWKVDRKCKEVIQAAVSVLNQCDYCADMHTTAAMSLGMSFRSVDALIHGKRVPKDADDIPHKLVLMVQWASISNQKGHAGLVSPPFPADEAPEIMAAATLKHYFNRITNTFVKFFTRAKGSFWKSKVFQKKAQDAKINTSFSIPPLPSQSLPFAAALSTHSITDLPSVENHFPHLLLYNDQSTEYPKPVSPRLSGFISLNMSASDISPQSSSINRNSAGSLYDISSSDVKEEKGRSSLPHNSLDDFMKNIMEKKGGWEGKLDDSFAWAKSNPIISEILCRWQLLEEQLARECLSPSVIDRLHSAVDEWNGSSSFTTQQLNEFVVDLTPAEQIMARLVISIAQDPKKVSSHLTNQFLSLYPTSVAPQFLIGACSYAAFYAAKHIAGFWSINPSHHLQRLLSSGRL